MDIGRLEIAILAALRRDAAAQRKQIAHDVGSTESNLSKKIAALKVEGYIKRFTIDIDYKLLGYNTSAVTFIKLEVQSNDIIERIICAALESENCQEAATVAGEWDIFIRWLCRDNSQVISSVRELLAESGSTAHVQTFFLAEIVENTEQQIINYIKR